jgi:acetyltransferase-like isoleucine patch superfamily enzyme
VTRAFIRAQLPSTRWRQRLPRGVVVGRHTYGHDRYTFPVFTDEARIVVGAFCSISAGVRILGGGEHVKTRPSTFPFNARMFDPAKRASLDAVDTGPTTIGNDVWIGLNAIILSGSTIGDGAVVGAGAVISGVVPPYAIVVGNPAQIVGYRFDSDTRDRLRALRWWEWDDETLRTLLPSLIGDAGAFLDQIRDHGRASLLSRRAPGSTSQS